MAERPEQFQRALQREGIMIQTFWEEYEICRTLQFCSLEIPVNKKGEKQLVVLNFPTGFSHLPYKGGIMDQPYFYIKVFRAFLMGERQGAMRRLQRKNLPFEV